MPKICSSSRICHPGVMLTACVLLVVCSQMMVEAPWWWRQGRDEGRWFAMKWLSESDLPLWLCQVQLLPHSCFSMHNISLIQSQWQQQLFAHSTRPHRGYRSFECAVLRGKLKGKIMVYTHIKMDLDILCNKYKNIFVQIQMICYTPAGRIREILFFMQGSFPSCKWKVGAEKGRQMLVEEWGGKSWLSGAETNTVCQCVLQRRFWTWISFS